MLYHMHLKINKIINCEDILLSYTLCNNKELLLFIYCKIQEVGLITWRCIISFIVLYNNENIQHIPVYFRAMRVMIFLLWLTVLCECLQKSLFWGHGSCLLVV